jgi:hypothetical protein
LRPVQARWKFIAASQLVATVSARDRRQQTRQHRFVLAQYSAPAGARADTIGDEAARRLERFRSL